MELPTALVLEPEVMVPAAAQGIVGITIRADDAALQGSASSGWRMPVSRIAATAERAVLAALDGSCRTPIGAHARLFAGREPEPDRDDCQGGRVVSADAVLAGGSRGCAGSWRGTWCGAACRRAG